MDFKDFNTQHYLDTFAQRYGARGFRVTLWPFVYGADFLPAVATTANQVALVAVDGDSDFVLCETAFACFTVPGVNVAAPNMRVELHDRSPDRALQTEPTHVMNQFGTGQRPHVWIPPYHLARKTILEVRVENLMPTDHNLRLSFVGVKVFITPGN